jgi:hypothetical protein
MPLRHAAADPQPSPTAALTPWNALQRHRSRPRPALTLSTRRLQPSATLPRTQRLEFLQRREYTAKVSVTFHDCEKIERQARSKRLLCNSLRAASMA